MLPQVDDPNVLVNYATSDDAGVYRQPDGSLLIATLDFFTPIVNDPGDFGAIAAANALSDVYAMGADPLFALNIIGFPKNELPLEILSEILKGGSAVAKEAGIFVIGGHSIDDKEPKYGMVVIGRLDDETGLLRNDSAQEGDALVLTKPLGTGILNTALKHRTVSDEELAEVIAVMRTLNRDAAELAVRYDVHALTDVTGFGLLGHLREMVTSSGYSAELYFKDIPVFERVVELIQEGEVPGGSRRNLLAVREDVNFGSLDEAQQILLADAQTSGGLLVSLPADYARAYTGAMHDRGHEDTSIIGRVTRKSDSLITVRNAAMDQSI